MKKLSLIALFATLLCSCAQFADEELSTQKVTAPESIEASFEEPASRTYVENDKYLRWTAGDEISYFPGITFNMEYRFTGVTGANNGSFSKVTVGPVTGNELSRNYAIYPYDEDIAVSDEGVISLNLPAVQKYAENSFGVGANTMVAATNGTNDEVLKFRNVGGYLKIKLYGDDVTVKSVKLQGNNNEKIAGPALITATYGNDPTVVMTAEATTSVTIDCEDGVTISDNSETPTEFWFVLPTVTFEDGFTITVTDVNDGTFVKSTSNTFTIDRNMIQPMKELNAVIEGGSLPDPEPEPDPEPDPDPVGPANNEIWYTNGSTTEPTTPYKTGAFGATYVSNTYDAEKECWVITFDGDVTSIGNSAFYGCSSLTSITIPEGVTSIGSAAFENCSSLTSITIPERVTSIEQSAFSECSSLTSITIPEGVTSIGHSAFSHCSSLTTITIPEGVTSIESWTFYYCSSLTSITIPESVTSIGMFAFSSCSNLKSVYITNIEKWSSIYFQSYNDSPLNNGAFLYLNGELVTEYTYADGVLTTGYAFAGCTSIQSIILPNGLISIDNNAFNGCSNLSTITIPESVTSIGESPFHGCANLKEFNGKFASTDGRCLIVDGVLNSFAPAGLTEYTIPDGVTSIGDYAFWDCSSLTSITIPEGVTSIGYWAFFSCSSLTSITIPEGVTSIETSAFNNCSSLKEVYCKPTTPPNGRRYMFDSNASGRKIYVPASDDDSIINAYKAASDWSYYASAIEEYEFD